MSDNLYDKKFECAIDTVIAHEGGYVNDSNDNGGETKYGISIRNHPEVNIESLTLDAAKTIYYQKYWKNQRYNKIDNVELMIKIFDLAINIGPYWSHIIVQRALRASKIVVDEDGILGSRSIRAVNDIHPNILLAAIKSESAGYYRSLVIADTKQKKFLRGWLNRAYI